jgi:DNA polymerase-1
MIQAALFSDAEINDLDATEFDQSEYIIDAAKLSEIEEAIKDYGKVAFDVETDGFTSTLVGAGLAWGDEPKSVYIPVGHVTQTVQLPLSTVVGFLNRLFKNVLVIPFNAAYELKVMGNLGVNIPNFTDARYFAVADDERNVRKSLKEIAKEHFGMEWGTIKQVCSRRVKERNANGRMVSRILFDIPGTPIEKLGRYCRTDCEATMLLYNKLVVSTEYATSIISLEKSVTPVVVAMENRGIRIDLPAVEKKLLEIRNKLVKLEEAIYAEAGRIINLNSPLQISAYLFDEIGLRTLHGRSVDVNTLQELKNDHIVPKLMLDYRELDKLRGTYLEPMLAKHVNGRIFTSLNQLGTESGRFSSSRPNMQNIPADPEIRKLFIATEGMLLLDYDYSQIEGRVFAHVSQDKTLLEYYRKGGDIHTATSDKLGIPRKLAKIINFAIIYGAAPRRLSDIMQKEGFIFDEQEARGMIRNFWKLYKGGNEWSKKLKETLHTNNTVFTIYGRRRIFPDINTVDNYTAFSMEREAVNHVIQGTAADIMKYALVGTHKVLKALNFPAYALLQIHDELLFEGYETEYEQADRIIRHQMEAAAILDVPLIVDGKKGLNWAEVH